jgi:hypothetical protein
VKATEIMHCALEASDALQLLARREKLLFAEIAPSEIAVVPPFVTTTDWGCVAPPTASVPKLKAIGASWIYGACSK